MKISNHLNIQQYIPTTEVYEAIKKSPKNRECEKDKPVHDQVKKQHKTRSHFTKYVCASVHTRKKMKEHKKRYVVAFQLSRLFFLKLLQQNTCFSNTKTDF